MTIAQDPPTTPSTLLEGYCSRCKRTTYVRRDAEKACPVCAAPLDMTAANKAIDLESDS
jgi:hypothetical protein